MPAGIVLASGRPTPAPWPEWHGSTLLRRVCGLVARGTGGPVVVVRAAGQRLPELPEGVRVVEAEGAGPLRGLLAGLRATDADVAFVAAPDLPLLHPRYVAAVCAAAGDADVVLPRPGGREQPLAAAYRPALAPLVEELVDEPAFAALFARARTHRLDEVPHPESAAADADVPEPRVHVRHIGPERRAPVTVRAATLGAAGAAAGVTLDDHVLAALNGARAARDPLEPLAEGDDVAFMAADPGG